MRKEIYFAYYSVKKYLRGETQMRAAFLTQVIGMTLNNIAFVVIWYQFGKVFGNVNGWVYTDSLALIGFATLGFGLCYTFFGGIRYLPDLVHKGDFDKFLLNPKSILLRVYSHKVTTSAIGDMLFGSICLGIWIYINNFGIVNILLVLLFSIMSGVFYLAFATFVSSLSFYLNDAKYITYGLMEFVMQPSQYYGGAVQGWLRSFLMFVIPALSIAIIPIETIKNFSIENLLYMLLFPAAWLFFSIWFFHRSLKKYESSNFINFG